MMAFPQPMPMVEGTDAAREFKDRVRETTRSVWLMKSGPYMAMVVSKDKDGNVSAKLPGGEHDDKYKYIDFDIVKEQTGFSANLDAVSRMHVLVAADSDIVLLFQTLDIPDAKEHSTGCVWTRLHKTADGFETSDCVPLAAADALYCDYSAFDPFKDERPAVKAEPKIRHRNRHGRGSRSETKKEDGKSSA
jgi:hypothetical protein